MLAHTLSNAWTMDIPDRAQGADPPPLRLRVAKVGRKHFNEETTPLLPTGIGERYSQIMSNLGHAALLRRSELPL
jgi:hypothetical protein